MKFTIEKISSFEVIPFQMEGINSKQKPNNDIIGTINNQNTQKTTSIIITKHPLNMEKTGAPDQLLQQHQLEIFQKQLAEKDNLISHLQQQITDLNQRIEHQSGQLNHLTKLNEKLVDQIEQLNENLTTNVRGKRQNVEKMVFNNKTPRYEFTSTTVPFSKVLNLDDPNAVKMDENDSANENNDQKKTVNGSNSASNREAKKKNNNRHGE